MRTPAFTRHGWWLALACVALSCSEPPKPPPEKTAFYPADATRCAIPKPKDDSCDLSTDPGRVTLRRLNQIEYNNSVRDLLGDTTNPANDFPADNVADGFDTNADVLSLSPLFMDQALLASQRLVDEAWAREAPAEESDTLSEFTGATHVFNGWEIQVGSFATTTIHLDASSFVGVSLRLSTNLPPLSPVVRVKLDGETLPIDQIPWTSGQASEVRAATSALVTQGDHTLSIMTEGDSDATVLIESAVWAARRPPVSIYNARLRTCDPDDSNCAKEIVTKLARRAWRRPLSDDDRSMLAELVSKGTPEKTKLLESNAEAGVKDALVAIFASPYFLFRVEIDPDLSTCAPHVLEDHELATRLSYTLWSTTPDEQLLSLADQCRLQDPAVYEAEIDRLLQSPRSQAFVRNFGGQWLRTRNLTTARPDPTMFPEFDDALRGAMQEETEALFSAFLKEDRPFSDLLDADFTFLNDRLAQHYGLALPGSTSLVRETLPPGTLGGLLSRAGVLTVTSQPTRTSPVKRGSWVLGTLLCSEPPPPPDNIPPLPSTGEGGGKTMKERLAIHRTDPVCANCHAAMDPIGLGLENYDPIGQWRTMDNGETIDPSGELPDGRTFQTPADLARLLKADPRLGMCVTKRLFTYALGRSPTGDDLPAMRELEGQFAQDGQRLRALVRRVLTSRAFTTRRADKSP